MRLSGRLLTMLALVLAAVFGAGFPAGAQDSTPEPTAVVIEEGGEAVGWRVAEARTLEVDGDPVAISPDGQWIAGVGPDREFCVWAVDSGDATCDGEGLPIRQESVVWAPDSSAVAFTFDAATYFVDSDLYVFDVAAGGIENLTEDGMDELPLFDPVDEPVHADTHPAWSPDGSALVFSRTTITVEEDEEDGSGYPTSIMRIDRAGGEPEEIYRILPVEPFVIYSPMYWLPDDTLLIAIARVEQSDGQNGIWRIGINGRNPRQVLEGDEESELPIPWIGDVAPDGSAATVMSVAKVQQMEVEDGAHALVSIPDGELTPITAQGDEPGGISMPVRLSPDGSTAVFSAGFSNLVLMDVATGEQGVVVPDLTIFRPTAMTGFQWTEGDVIFGVVQRGTAVLLELERTD